jgi:hypothetical protein
VLVVPDALGKPAYCIAALRLSPIRARLWPARSAAPYVDSATGIRATAAERLGLDLWGRACFVLQRSVLS